MSQKLGEFGVGREGDTPRLIYVFDDALVAVSPSRAVSLLCLFGHGILTLPGGPASRLAERSLRRKSERIAFLGERATSTSVAAAVPRTRRIPVNEISTLELAAPGRRWNRGYSKLTVRTLRRRGLTLWISDASRGGVIELLAPTLGPRFRLFR